MKLVAVEVHRCFSEAHNHLRSSILSIDYAPHPKNDFLLIVREKMKLQKIRRTKISRRLQKIYKKKTHINCTTRTTSRHSHPVFFFFFPKSSFWGGVAIIC